MGALTAPVVIRMSDDVARFLGATPPEISMIDGTPLLERGDIFVWTISNQRLRWRIIR